jgi:hypothetical protein
MHTRDFLEQAVLLTSQFEVVVMASRRLPETALQRYWVASRSRFDTWGIGLRHCTDDLDRTNYAVDRLWLRWTPFLEEILLSEIVTRIWSYLLDAMDERLGTHEYSPIGQSAFRAHIDARRRVLNLILRGRQRGLPAVWRLNRLRLNAERWTDLLLGQIDERDWMGNYAFDPERVRRFGGQEDRRARPVAILSAASRAAFVESGPVPRDHAELHSRMHAAMLGCFGHELFLGNGQMMSDWQARLLALTDDTQCLLDRWLEGPVHDQGPESPGTLRRF